MIILPSLLEYTREHLNQKTTIVQNVDTKSITHQQTLSLHLDFVMENFAKDRKVMESLSFSTMHRHLMEKFKNTKLDLSVHFMGGVEDLTRVYKVLQQTEFNPQWNYLFLVPEKFIKTFSDFKQKNVKIGVWYDLEEWPPKPLPNTTHLLMTVKAGLSGQKLSRETKNKALAYVYKHPNSFILDGGWSIDFQSNRDNLYIVSHSSFWNNIHNKH